MFEAARRKESPSEIKQQIRVCDKQTSFDYTENWNGIRHWNQRSREIPFEQNGQKDSRTLAHLVHFFDDDRENFRRVLIGAAIEIFCSYEDQFRKLTCSGGERRAMQKLAKAVSRRVFNYMLDKEKVNTVTKTDFIKGE